MRFPAVLAQIWMEAETDVRRERAPRRRGHPTVANRNGRGTSSRQ